MTAVIKDWFSAEDQSARLKTRWREGDSQQYGVNVVAAMRKMNHPGHKSGLLGHLHP